MLRCLLAALVATLLLAGCAKPAPPPPTPAPPSAPAPVDASPAVTAPAAGRWPLPRLTGEILYVEVYGPTGTSQRLQLWPERDEAVVGAIAAAVDTAGEGRLREGGGAFALNAWVRLRSLEYIILTLPADGGPVQASWNGQPLVIDSPDLKRVLEALKPHLAVAPEPGLKLWAMDPAGTGEPELLARLPEALSPTGVSPDGRILLLVKHLGEYKGDLTAIPYLLDRTTGRLTQGPKTNVRFARWSGTGFFIDRLTHLSLDLQVEEYADLARALGLKEQERAVVAIDYSADGKRFAALVGHPHQELPLDLVQGNLDGSGLSLLPAVLSGWATQIGNVAGLAISPDGKWLALTGKEGTFLAPVATPAPDRWTRLLGEVSGAPSWAPDSRHIWLGDSGIVDLSGRVLFRPDKYYSLTWQPDGQGGVLYGIYGMRVFRLDAMGQKLQVPDFSYPAGFLPDGRLLLYRLDR